MPLGKMYRFFLSEVIRHTRKPSPSRRNGTAQACRMWRGPADELPLEVIGSDGRVMNEELRKRSNEPGSRREFSSLDLQRNRRWLSRVGCLINQGDTSDSQHVDFTLGAADSDGVTVGFNATTVLKFD